jgi:hypothetical protein
VLLSDSSDPDRVGDLYSFNHVSQGVAAFFVYDNEDAFSDLLTKHKEGTVN